MKRKTLFWTLGIIVSLVIVAAVIGSFSGNRERGTQVEVAEAELRTVTQVVTASGRVQPETEVKISSDVSGEIIELRVREGDEVRQGDVLLRISPNLYIAQVEQLRAAVAQAQSGLVQAEASFARAQQDFARQQALFNAAAISQAEFEVAQTQVRIQEASLNTARFGVQSAEARLREVSEQLRRTTITAPISGTISQLNVELGERVVGTLQMTGTEILRIARLDVMEMEVEVNENDIVNVSVNDTSRVSLDAFPDVPFKGVVTEIAQSARLQMTGGQDQVTNFRVKVRVLAPMVETAGARVLQDEVPIDRSSLVLRPGMSGQVDIFTRTEASVLAIPRQAVTVRDMNRIGADSLQIQGEDLRRVVFVVQEGKVALREVATGIADATHIVILRGLEAGDTVVTGPFSAVSRSLKPDDAVRIREATTNE